MEEEGMQKRERQEMQRAPSMLTGLQMAQPRSLSVRKVQEVRSRGKAHDKKDGAD